MEQASVQCRLGGACVGICSLPFGSRRYVVEGVVHSAGALGAVFRTVLETMRTLFVWLVDLLLFYTPLGFGSLGESWSKYSFIQAAG